MKRDVMLSTVDNPFNPQKQFDEWYAYDIARGYHTLGLLARIAKIAPNFPDSVNDEIIDDAIDEILRENVSGVHIGVEVDPNYRSVE